MLAVILTAVKKKNQLGFIPGGFVMSATTGIFQIGILRPIASCYIYIYIYDGLESFESREENYKICM